MSNGRGRISSRKSLKLLAKDGTALGHDRGVDRPLPPGSRTPAAPAARAQDRRSRSCSLPWCSPALPGWIRPTVTSRAHPHGAGHRRSRSKPSSPPPARSCPKWSACSRARSTRACSRILQRPGAHLKQGDPVVELDISESVLALDKVIKDLKIKENQQAQTRLTLEKSLVDLDGRLEVKAPRAPVGAGPARCGSAAVQRGALLPRVAAPIRACGQAGADRADAAYSRSAATRRSAAGVQLEGLALERGSLDKEAAQARRLLDLSTTKSDRDGVLTWVLSQEGALVRRGDVIARIADLTSFRVTATVSDVHAGRLRTGMPIDSPAQRRRPAGNRQRGLPDRRERRAAIHRRARPAIAPRPAAEPARRRPRSSPTASRARCA